MQLLHCSLIKAKTAPVVVLILKKTYFPVGSVIISSVGGAVLFGSAETPQVCAFPCNIMTSPGIPYCRIDGRGLQVCLAKCRIPCPMIYSSLLLDSTYYFLLSFQY